MTPPANDRENAPAPISPDEQPGVPGFRSWRGVYGFVFGFFLAVVVALTAFSRVYS